MRQRIVGSLVGLLTVVGLCAVVPIVNHPVREVPGRMPTLEFVPTQSASALIRVLSALDPNSRVLRAVAIDLDVDGDLDLVATTADEVVVVWVNEGRGRLVRQNRPSKSRLSSLPNFDRSGSNGRTLAAASGSTAGAALAAAFDDIRGLSAFPTSPSSRVTTGRWDPGSGRAPPVRG